MRIQLKEWQVTNLNLSLVDATSSRDKNSFDLETGSRFSDEEGSSEFAVGLKVTIKDTVFDLFIESVFQFELIDEKVTEEFKLSSFPKVNAPAIAFPYLRAFISNLTLQSGFAPVILPSINFVNLANQDTDVEEGN